MKFYYYKLGAGGTWLDSCYPRSWIGLETYLGGIEGSVIYHGEGGYQMVAGSTYTREAYNEVGDEDSACTLTIMGKEKYSGLSWDWIGNLFGRNLGIGH